MTDNTTYLREAQATRLLRGAAEEARSAARWYDAAAASPEFAPQTRSYNISRGNKAIENAQRYLARALSVNATEEE